MKILVFGSLNIDRTYSVEHFVCPGETISATKLELFCGGKGFNQAIALARAGNPVYFAGAAGEDGDMLSEGLSRCGIDTSLLLRVPGPSGHAVIQLSPEGQNCIIISAGANGCISPDYVDSVLAQFSPGDLIVLQNEISCVDYIISCARRAGLLIAFNPSPLNGLIGKCSIDDVDYLLVNEVEGAALSGKTEPDDMLGALRAKYPHCNILLTLGSQGSVYMDREGRLSRCGIYELPVADTTAAGDTFSGYFLSEITKGADAKSALKLAAIAGGLAVSRKGASPSIPRIDEVRAADPSLLRDFEHII